MNRFIALALVLFIPAQTLFGMEKQIEHPSYLNLLPSELYTELLKYTQTNYLNFWLMKLQEKKGFSDVLLADSPEYVANMKLDQNNNQIMFFLNLGMVKISDLIAIENNIYNTPEKQRLFQLAFQAYMRDTKVDLICDEELLKIFLNLPKELQDVLEPYITKPIQFDYTSKLLALADVASLLFK